MRKITFITLVMILGMTSVSFGKQFLCKSKLAFGIRPDLCKNGEMGCWKVQGFTALDFLVKTDALDSKIMSVYQIGEEENKKSNYLCVTQESSDYYHPNSTSSSVISETRGKVLTCRRTRSGEKRTYFEFNYELDTKYWSANHMIGVPLQLIGRGTCQAI